jgi:rhodanese-related sulfurtransferase
MKHFILGFTFVCLASVAAAQSQTDWSALVTGSGSSGYAVEGATKIDVSTAKTLHDQGVVFIDARSKRKWKQGHIPGASNLYYNVTEAALMEIVDKDEEVVFYCGGTDCSLSPKACAKALTWGYKNVYYFAEGSPGWEAAGYPLEKAE